MARGSALAWVAVAALAAVPAFAADKKKDKVPLRWARTYAGALAEAKERNCVLYVTMHAEH
jgi:hypothetical protein